MKPRTELKTNTTIPSSSSSRPLISVPEALIHLLGYIKEPDPRMQLKRLLFLGIRTPMEHKELELWLKSPLLEKFSVSLPSKKEPHYRDYESSDDYRDALESYEAKRIEHFKMINLTPSKRYLETHLAYETLLLALADLELSDLEKHHAHLESWLPTTTSKRKYYSDDLLATLPDTLAEVIRNILKGDFTHLHKHVTPSMRFAEEYSTALKQLEPRVTRESKEIKKGDSSDPSDFYSDFSSEERRKMQLLLKSPFLCITLTGYISLPINIYHEDYYLPENRGTAPKLDTKGNPQDIQSPYLGLMLSYMWTPWGDKARAHKTDPTKAAGPYMRVVDRNTFNPNAQWPKDNFSHLVHPFSSSISGTLLIQMRGMKLLQENKQLVFNNKDKLSRFLRCLIPLMIFSSGGHSFHEFTFPLILPKMKEAWSSCMEGFDTIDNESLFFTGNQIAFEKALQKTIAHNKMILDAKLLHHELQNHPTPLRRSSLFKKEPVGDAKTNASDEPPKPGPGVPT